MNNNTQRTTKGQASGSIILRHGILDGSSRWSRCNSFSSCSNDSSVSSNDHHPANSGFSAEKCLKNKNRTVGKRNRNSSGSSVSSNMSSISDKDSKNNTSVILSNSVPQVSTDQPRIMGGVQGLVSEEFGLPHQALLNERLSCPDVSNSVLPFRHNLRRNIRKKTCSCDCTATCTTLVVRRYKEIGKETVEEKTVISSTKVQTCRKSNGSQEIQKVSFEKSFSPSKSDNRKRRSEVEKLYDSLHEIEWAKNFSPDNILRQLNIRQAASCSMFGRASSEERSPKKQKTNSNQSRKSSESRSPTHSTRRSTLRSHTKNRTFKRRNSRSPRTRSSKASPVQNESSSKRLNRSPVQEKNLKLAVNEHIKLTNGEDDSYLNCNSIQSFHVSSKDKLKYKVNPDDQSSSSSAVSIPKLDFKTDSEIISEMTSDYSISPLFDIAEEGIRTIDACFREVGAEVVISTCYEEEFQQNISSCYEEEFQLPLLTAVKENNSPNKFVASSDDTPPILECCIDIPDQKEKCNDSSGPSSPNNYVHKESIAESEESQVELKEDILNCDGSSVSEHVNRVKNLKSSHGNSVNRSVTKSLIKGAGKRIMNKYIKLLRSKFQSNSTNKCKILQIDSGAKVCETLPSARTLRSSNNSLHNKKSNKGKRTLSHLSPEQSFNMKPPEICLDGEGDGRNVTMLQTSKQMVSFSKSPEKITFNHRRSKSMIYTDNKRSFTQISSTQNFTNHSLTREPSSSQPNTSENIANKSIVVMQKKISPFTNITTNSLVIKQSSCQKSESGIRNFMQMKEKEMAIVPCVPIKYEEERKIKEEIPRPPTFAAFSCHYGSITVTRNSGYTQVVLKPTRTNAAFLTLETLIELKDILHRAGQDSHCHTFILNGVGHSFCLGLDLRPLLGPQKIKASTDMAVAVKDCIEAFSSLQKPMVAAVNGAAFGLGMTLLNHADVIIASDTATFCMPQSSLGYFPEGGATLTLPLAVGSTTAMDLILRGRIISAKEAKDIGLVSEVMSESHLPYDLVSRVKMLAKNSQQVLETTKAMLKMRLHLELRMVLENEVKLLPQMWLSEPCQAALENAAISGLLADSFDICP